MIPEFVKAWDERKDEVRSQLVKEHPDSYDDLVKMVLSILDKTDKYSIPDPERVEGVDHGDYQGTIVYVIPEKRYQPSTYWYVPIAYGSCSVCDTLQSIREYSDEPPTEEQVKLYMNLALHIIQYLKQM